MKKPKKDSPKCPLCNSHPTIRKGFRKSKLRTTQRFLCKSCKKYFTIQSPLQKSKTYNLKTILDAISAYNLGTPLRKMNLKLVFVTFSKKVVATTKKTSLKHSVSQVPKSTIHNWIKTINLPMNRLRNKTRNKIKNQPTNNIIIKQQFIHHKQPFLYQYHSLKLEFAKKFPTLIQYIKEINQNLPQKIFSDSQRISQTSKRSPNNNGRSGGGWPRRGARPDFFEEKIGRPIIIVGASLKEKQNYAVKLAKVAKAITKDNKKRHQIIEDFMLINDTATLATEIPVYLLKNELETLGFSKANKNLTGHIDILQIRYHKIYILDYKPEPINQKQTINQLKLYREALSKRTSIPKHKFKLAFFNDNGYYEIT